MKPDHTHTISNFDSGYTDTTNGHRHALWPSGCPLCKEARLKLFAIGIGFCEETNLHHHFYIATKYKLKE